MLRKFWQHITASRRAVDSVAADSPSSRAPMHDAGHIERALREEIARLRAENRALLNSILGIAGIPPIVVSEAETATEAAMLNISPPTLASDAAAPSRNASACPPWRVSPANLTLPLNLPLSSPSNFHLCADGEYQTNTEIQKRGRDARVTQNLDPSQNRASDSFSSAPRPDKPESPAPKHVRFKTDLRAPRRGTPQKNAAAPRRRSWQQINRMLELASARKPPQET